MKLKTNPCQLQSIGENHCGFCGQDGCLTQLKEKKHGGLSVIPLCWDELQNFPKVPHATNTVQFRSIHQSRVLADFTAMIFS
jgi:hypothetical protein